MSPSTKVGGLECKKTGGRRVCARIGHGLDPLKDLIRYDWIGLDLVE